MNQKISEIDEQIAQLALLMPGYEGLNMQVRETSIHKTSGFSSYFFHTPIKQRPQFIMG